MSASQLKVGDRVKIIGIGPANQPGFSIPASTRRVWRRLMKRRSPVRIREIRHGQPWYQCRIQRPDGTWEYHELTVNDGDQNWVKV